MDGERHYLNRISCGFLVSASGIHEFRQIENYNIADSTKKNGTVDMRFDNCLLKHMPEGELILVDRNDKDWKSRLFDIVADILREDLKDWKLRYFNIITDILRKELFGAT